MNSESQPVEIVNSIASVPSAEQMAMEAYNDLISAGAVPGSLMHYRRAIMLAVCIGRILESEQNKIK